MVIVTMSDKIAVLGATGRTGRRLVAEAVARGHEVVAVARGTGEPLAGVSRRPADVLDREALAQALDGCDRVISTLGVGTSRAPTHVYSCGVANALSAGISRVVAVSAAPVGDGAGLAWSQRRVALPLLRRVWGATYADMAQMEAVLRSSPAAWTVLRPPRLIDRDAGGSYRLTPGGSITTGDLAVALLDALERCELAGRVLDVSS